MVPLSDRSGLCAVPRHRVLCRYITYIAFVPAISRGASHPYLSWRVFSRIYRALALATQVLRTAIRTLARIAHSFLREQFREMIDGVVRLSFVPSKKQEVRSGISVASTDANTSDRSAHEAPPLQGIGTTLLEAHA